MELKGKVIGKSMRVVDEYTLNPINGIERSILSNDFLSEWRQESH